MTLCDCCLFIFYCPLIMLTRFKESDIDTKDKLCVTQRDGLHLQIHISMLSDQVAGNRHQPRVTLPSFPPVWEASIALDL